MLEAEKFACFVKGLVHDFGQKSFTFLAQIDQKVFLAMFLIENELFKTKKTLILESCKICIFYKGFNSQFWSKS